MDDHQCDITKLKKKHKFLVLWESRQLVRFYGNNFITFRPNKLWKTLNFEQFLSLKTQLNYKNWFWNEK